MTSFAVWCAATAMQLGQTSLLLSHSCLDVICLAAGLCSIIMQAVAGIVGCAELLCAALSCPALLLYFMAVDGRYAAAQRVSQQGASSCSVQATVAGKSQSSNQHGAGSAAKPGVASASNTAVGTSHEPAAAEQPLLLLADALQHWLLVLAAAVLAFSAALSKEIGITVVGTMLLYDIVLASHIRQLGVQASSSSSGTLMQQQRACRRMLLRMVFIAATAVVYVKLRQWVAVQQLVQIYRKVCCQGRDMHKPSKLGCNGGAVLNNWPASLTPAFMPLVVLQHVPSTTGLKTRKQ